ncbi:uncharacterized protein LOC128955387 [Oppia nitens]|uniref:uncharacterized protein LOC128955387 n=1 Tax=Oppia nitens TaxID=1686743 RepID=UPI0023DC5FD5|nr:uncharacterized protein LOC128955387 [Oppia nitens]
MNFVYLTFLLLYSVINIIEAIKYNTDSHKNSLFFIYNETADWQSADRVCRQQNLQLVVVQDVNYDVKGFAIRLDSLSSSVDNSNSQSKSTYYAIPQSESAKDHQSSMSYKNSIHKRDITYAKYEIRCIVVDKDLQNVWIQKPCVESAVGFMCSKSTIHLKIVKSRYLLSLQDNNDIDSDPDYNDYVCPTYQYKSSDRKSSLKWLDIDKGLQFCYLFSADIGNSLLKTTWAEASLKCKSINGNLVAIHESTHKSLLKVIDKLRDSTWIGLRETQTGQFEWEDNSALDFTQWDTGANGDYKKCVSMRTTDLKWTAHPCFDITYMYDFICQIKKVLPGNVSTVEPSHEPLESPQVVTEMPAIVMYFMIIMGVVLVVSVGANIVFVSKRVKLINMINSNNNRPTNSGHNIECTTESTVSKSTGSSSSSNGSVCDNNNKNISESMERRRRFNEMLHSNDPNVVFSNIKLKN